MNGKFIRAALTGVAQIFNLLYRRLAVGRASALPKRTRFADVPQIPNRRSDRVRLCATMLGVFGRVLTLAVLLLTAASGSAQWVTQSFELKAGWNAVYLHVDASHATLSELIDVTGNPIQEVWLWRAEPATSQFVDNPKVPTTTGSQWYNWNRPLGPSSPLQRLTANAAYLVRVDNATATFTWNLKGKPVPPKFRWTTTGLNFVGFPTPAATAPSFESFLGFAPEIQQSAEIYRYPGGTLGPGNPIRVLGLRTASVRRGEAFWMRSGTTFNRYFGPFEISLQDSRGAHFGDSMARYQLRIRNIIDSALTVRVALQNSETPPTGQQAIVQAPPILVRGELDPSTLGHSHTNFSGGPLEWTLAPKGQIGSEAEIVFGINRTAMTGNPGDFYAAVLRFTDNLGFSQIDIPVSAVVASKAGLWVGQANVSQVNHFLVSYQRNAAGQAVTGPDGRHLATAANTNLGRVPRSFPVRLILHNNEADRKTYLLQRVFYGTGNTPNSFVTRWYVDPVVSWSETALKKEEVVNAFRISAAHLPFSQTNRIWLCEGELKQGTTLTATVVLDYNDPVSNPFLHTYHPDHDNLNATFDAQVPQGFESYRVERQVILRVTPPLLSDFSSLTSGSNMILGEYEEVITLSGRTDNGEVRRFNVKGDFTLSRITDLPFLTPPVVTPAVQQ